MIQNSVKCDNPNNDRPHQRDTTTMIHYTNTSSLQNDADENSKNDKDEDCGLPRASFPLLLSIRIDRPKQP